MTDEPRDPLPPGEEFAPWEPNESPLAWRPPWLRNTPAPDEIATRGPSEERAEALRALLEFPQETTRRRRLLTSAAPFFWMVLLGAAVTAGIGLVARTSVPAIIGAWLPDLPRQDGPPAASMQAAHTSQPVATAPAAAGQPPPAIPPGGDASEAGAPVLMPVVTGSSRGDDPSGRDAQEAAQASSGGIDVRSSAPGVWVEIEGVAQGRAPLRVSKLAAGPYVLRITRPEGSIAQTIYVVGGEVTRIHVPGASARPAGQGGPMLTTAASESMPEFTTFASMEVSQIELPVFVVDDPPVVPTGEVEPVATERAAEPAANPPEPVNERLPPIPAPFPRPDGARIVLDLTIDTDGRVQTINVRRSDDHSVNATVVSAARQWRYRPATRNGVPVPSVRTVDIPLSVK